MLRCRRVDCPCTEVTFSIVELPEVDGSTERLTKINIRVDVLSWQEIDLPERSREEEEVVAEFLRDYPPAERQKLQAYFDDRQALNRRLDKSRIPPARLADGAMVEFRDFLQPVNSTAYDSRLGEYIVEHDGVQYIAIEHYCPNPECLCGEVVLSFLRCEPSPDADGRRRAEEQFGAKLSLDGDVALDKVFFGSRSEAEAVLAAWAEEWADDLDELRWRYDKIKEIARRSDPPQRRLLEIGSSLPRLAPTSLRVGRNDPCPCGSGKKYKKCCGPAAKAAPTSAPP